MPVVGGRIPNMMTRELLGVVFCRQTALEFNHGRDSATSSVDHGPWQDSTASAAVPAANIHQKGSKETHNEAVAHHIHSKPLFSGMRDYFTADRRPQKLTSQCVCGKLNKIDAVGKRVRD